MGTVMDSKSRYHVWILLYVVYIIIWDLQAQLAALVADLTEFRDRNTIGLSGRPGLVEGTVSKKVPKTSANVYAFVGTTMVLIATGTAMTALAGTVAINKFALWAFYTTSTGTISTSTKTADAVSAAAAYALFPTTPTGKALLGWIIVTNNATGGFVGGTDDLDKSGNTVIYGTGYGHAVSGLAQTSGAPLTIPLAA